jgi:hypothetical protein
MLGDGLGVTEDQQGQASQDEAQTKLASGLFRGPGTVCTKMAAMVT